MRRWSLFILALVAMLGVALIGRGSGIAAQDATPANRLYHPERVSCGDHNPELRRRSIDLL